VSSTKPASVRLVRAGKVRAIGASDLKTWRIAKSLTVSRLNGWASYISGTAALHLSPPRTGRRLRSANLYWRRTERSGFQHRHRACRVFCFIVRSLREGHRDVASAVRRRRGGCNRSEGSAHLRDLTHRAHQAMARQKMAELDELTRNIAATRELL
jgi:hypothetical protein